jgi:hypothetical protein
VGPAADVYALGAILYECLTGRPPFKAATVQETLLLVLHNDPVPPRQLQPGLPRDLETICLKCLHKGPQRRYASAAELADDLGRYLDGRPVRARSVGPLGRAARWARRRPAVSLLLAALVLALLGGTVAARHFALRERERGEDARKAQVEAGKALAQTEEALADSLLAGLGRQTDYPGHPAEGPINDVELRELWRLARLLPGRDRVRVLFVERALGGVETAAQLERRRDFAVHAAVGLDPGRRARVCEVLLAALRRPEADWRVRRAAARAGLSLDLGGDPEFARAAAPALLQALANLKSPDPNGFDFDVPAEMSSLAKGLAALAVGLDRPEAEKACSAAFTKLQEFMANAEAEAEAKGMILATSKDAVEILAALGPWLSKAQAQTVGAQFARQFSHSGSPTPADVSTLAALRARLGEVQRQAVADELARALRMGSGLTLAEEALAAFTGGLEKLQEPQPDAAEELAMPAPDLDAAASQDPAASQAVADFHRLAALAPRLEKDQVRALADQLVAGMSKTVPKEAPPGAAETRDNRTATAIARISAQGLATLAPRLDPAGAQALVAEMVAAIQKTKDGDYLLALLEGLAPLTGRLDRGSADKAWTAAAAQLAEVYSTRPPQGTSPEDVPLEGMLRALAPRLTPAAAGILAARLAEATSKTADGFLLGRLAQGVMALVPRLDAAQAERACTTVAARLAALVTRTTAPDFNLVWLVGGGWKDWSAGSTRPR